MTRIERLDPAELTEQHRAMLETIEATYGAPPNSFLTLGRMPDVLDAAARLSLAVMRDGQVTAELKWLVANVASRVAGCSYCTAHTGFHAHSSGGALAEKVEAVWEFETSPRFSDSERAALRLARAAAMVPNEASKEHFDEARKHFNDDQIAEVIAAVALFGFFNRWNDTMATELEQSQADFAHEHLGSSGWRPKAP